MRLEEFLRSSQAGWSLRENSHLIVGDEQLGGKLGDLANVVVTLLQTQTSETQGRLTTTTVLLGQIDQELVQHCAGVAAHNTEKGTVTIHNDEAELVVTLQQLVQRLKQQNKKRVWMSNGGKTDRLGKSAMRNRLRVCRCGDALQQRWFKSDVCVELACARRAWQLIKWLKEQRCRTSVWNLLSHRYREVLIGLKGSKSMLTFFSLPSAVMMVPQYRSRPLLGTRLYSFKR